MILEISGSSSVSLELGQIYLLGKEPSGDGKNSRNFIELDDGEENISKRHCVIETNQNEEAFVFDLFSFKGTILNNNILNSMKKTLLKNGDILKVGSKEIRYVHEGHEMSCDSSGFLEVQKNNSDLVASSPESASKTPNPLKQAEDHKFLMPSTSFSSRRSDSFTIPETQYCKSRNSLNDSKLCLGEKSNADKSDGKINFNFGQDSFEDDDFCIPETQELPPPQDGSSSSQKPDMPPKSKQSNILHEECSMLDNENVSHGSQFRICTQDYNEGFGEEETVNNLHSQIIPIIKHSPFIINKIAESSIKNSINRTVTDQAEKEMSLIKPSNSNTDVTKLRPDCITPDIFDFEAVNNKEDNENTNEDQEDFLPTQRLPPVLKNLEVKQICNELDEPCLEKETQEVLILSDKENRCPTKTLPITDVAATQVFEARCHTIISNSNSASSGVKANTSQANKNVSHSLLSLDADEEDDLLTQTFLQPKRSSINTSNISGNNLPTKCFNSTLLDDKCTEKTPATFFAEFENNPPKQKPSSSANVFKKPNKDFSFSKKTSTASSTVSENDIDLLMCTPKFIKDNLCLEKSEVLKKHILEVKNRYLFGDETEDEDEEQNNLVKLINVPKSSLDFDQLLPHLHQTPECGKEQPNEQKEAQKIYKFNISFGKEQDEKQSKSSSSKSSSSYSRDERHAARDKEKETSMPKSKSKAHKAATKRQEKIMEKEVENTMKKQEKEVSRKKRKVEKDEKDRKLTEKEQPNNHNKPESIQKMDQVQVSSKPNKNEDTNTRPASTSRLRKRQISAKNEKQEPQTENQPQEAMPAKRVTRLKSRSQGISLPSSVEHKEHSEPIVKLTRSRSKQSDSQDKTSSNTSTKSSESKTIRSEQNKATNSDTIAKKTERKRRTEAPTAAPMPAEIESKRLRSSLSQESVASPSPCIAISITSVDQELIKELLKSAKGLWHIATNPADCDILVMDKPLRTFKFLLAMARGIPIVTSQYLTKLNQSKSVKEVSLKDYYFSDSAFEKKYKFSLLKSLQAAKTRKMFKDYEFLMTASILPIPQEIKAIIEASGGYVHTKNPPQPRENQILYLVTAKEDKKDWHRYRRLNKNIIIVSTEAIMSAIMSQSPDRMKRFLLA